MPDALVVEATWVALRAKAAWPVRSSRGIGTAGATATDRRNRSPWR